MESSDLLHRMKRPLSEDERRRQDMIERGRHDRLEHMRELNHERAILEAFEQEGELLRQEREEKSKPKDIKITNPRWEHVDQDIAKERPDSVYIGETIKLIVDQENGDTRPIEFQVKDWNINPNLDPERGVEDIRSKIESTSPEVQWLVVDPRSKKEADREMDVFFLAQCKSVSSDQCKIQVLNARTMQVLEVEDCLFRHNSAVFLPDATERDNQGSEEQEQVTGLSVLKAILLHAHENPEKKIVVAGHTDRSGSDEYNFQLSKERSESIVAIIEDDRDSWIQLANNRHTDEDIQHLMKWISGEKGWNCNPGAIDGIIGNNTKNAIKVFQENAGLTADGIIGPQSFGGIYDLIQESLTSKMSSDSDKPAFDNRGSLNWAYEIKAVGCGEMFPITDEMKSQTDRRVEILFFEEQELPTCACVDGICQKEQCPIYKDGMFTRELILPSVPNLKSGECIVMLNINPNDASSFDDVFTLKGIDCDYFQQKTVKDDFIEGNNTTDLLFNNIEPEKLYKLLVYPGGDLREVALIKEISGKNLLRYK